MKAIEIKYHGHSCFEINHEDNSLIIDPWLSGNPFAKIKPNDVKVDAILVTHGHFDHLGDAIYISKKIGAKIFAISELASYCEMKGAIIEKMHIGGRKKFPFGTIKFTPAWHSSSVREDGQIIYTGMPTGILVKINNKTIYHAGDTGLFGDMKMIGELESIDLALLPIGGRYVMDIEDAAIATDWLRAKAVIPMHYNSFEGIEQDPEEFRKIAKKSKYEVIILNSGESYYL